MYEKWIIVTLCVCLFICCRIAKHEREIVDILQKYTELYQHHKSNVRVMILWDIASVTWLIIGLTWVLRIFGVA